MQLRLQRFEIIGLFGLYDHKIGLNTKERITLIIGPNGRGKTVCLKFIEALFSNRFGYFTEIPFERAEFVFTTGERITVTPPEKEGDLKSPTLVLFKNDGSSYVWAPVTMDQKLVREVRRYLPPTWQSLGDGLWIDESDGEEVTTRELVVRFGIPQKLIDSLQPERPIEFKGILNGIDCHLIETQRLLVLQSGFSDDNHHEYFSPRRRSRDTRLAIQQKAMMLKAILKDTLTRYANLSQSLDRTFPLRVFEAQGTASLSQDELRQELSRLDEARKALMSAGIIDTEYEAVSLRSGNIEPGVAMALEIYVKDARQKLEVFDNLRGRIDLFKELIDRRFIDKSIQVDRELGYRITSKTGDSVPLDKLSSGEQHQLILLFDLLFEVTENSLILIDEPELSLHVSWQKSFIESLQRIIRLNAFDVLLATHSPAVVARHFNLAVELGPVDDLT
jgi:ABC-type Mn2+/Zn2+ transport system ATPase subunit